jgi:two-component system sensor histidine kinase QseC
LSIQSKLIKLIISLVTIATFIAAMHGYRNSQQQINTILDEEIQTLAAFILTSQTGINNERNAAVVINKELPDHKAYQVFSSSGALFTRSANAPNQPISSATGFSEEAFAGTRWRTFTLRTQDAYVIVAQADKYRRKVTEDILLATITPIVFSIPLIGLLIYYIIRKSLSPLRYLSTQLTNKHSEDLSGVHIQSPSKELIPVVNRLNELFNRLASSFELEKQLSANAAHELRTPVSVLAIAAKNLVSDFEKGKLTKAHFTELSNNVERMAQVIEQIISLFRFNPDTIASQKSDVDLQKVLQEVITNNYLAIENERQNVELIAQSTHLWASEFALYVLFENLLRNANKYGGEACLIRLSLFDFPTHIEVQVEDSGQGLASADMEQLTTRFFRAKNQTRVKGSGLGLAISKHILNLHQGSLQFSRSELGGLKVLATIPKGDKHVA